MTPTPRRQPRGTARRDAIVAAAAALLLEVGPAALTHRTIAQRAEVPLAATTYYFSSLDDLVGAAGAVLAARWAGHAHHVAATATAVTAGATTAGAAATPAGATSGTPATAVVLVDAILPQGDDAAVRGHYEHLVAAGRSTALASAYQEGRAGLDDAVTELVGRLGAPVTPDLLVAVVDGAAVTALSEGRDVRTLARTLVGALLDDTRPRLA